MSDKNRPNVLLIMTDQHRLSACGAYGPTPCQTPHIDALAQRGMLFRQAYCPTAICSRASKPANGDVTLIVMALLGILATSAVISNLSQMTHACYHDDSNRLRALRLATPVNGISAPNTTNRLDIKRLSDEPPSTLGFTTGHDFAGHGGGGFGDPIFTSYLKDMASPITLIKWMLRLVMKQAFGKVR